jgi:capsular exopolysaccharide synthesis family protein
MPAEETVDIREYVAVLRRRSILLLVVIIGFTGLSIAYSFSRTPLYTARAEVLLLPASTSSQYRPDQLVSVDTEARLVRSAQVAELARDSLDWPVTLPNLLQNTNVQTTMDTLVLDIFYTNHDPQRAAEGANALADAYLTYKRQRSDAADLATRKGIQDQINVLERQRNALDQKLSTLPVGSTDYKEAQQEQDALTGQIAVFTSQLASIPPISDPGEVILPAEVPVAPSSPKHVLDVALGLFLGTFIGVVLAFVRDRVDERVTGRSDLEATIDAPILASIPRVAGLKRRGPVMLVTEQQPRSSASEAYRTLRTGVMAMNRQRDRKVFAIVSPMPGEGKSSTASNLAVTLAQADKRVLLISADLRQPSLHLFFRVSNEIGLADVLLGEVPLEEATRALSPNLWFVSSGRPSVRSGELLQSHRMMELIPQQRERFDYVIIDCPPVLGLADTLAMAPFVDAVLMVARAEKSKRSALVHAVDQLYQVGADVVGGVLNDVPISRRTRRYGYGYGYGFREEPDAPEVASTSSRTRKDSNGSSGENGSGRVSRRPSPLDEELVDGRSQVVSRSERAET